MIMRSNKNTMGKATPKPTSKPLSRATPLARTTPLARKTPMAQGTIPLVTTKPMARGSVALARTPMQRGQVQLVAKKPMARGDVAMARNAKPMNQRSKTNSNPRAGQSTLLSLVRGHPCYLLLPGILSHDLATVVPAHSNQAQHGKGMGIKAHDEFTVPACAACHAELDQGKRFTREQKFEFWNKAYAAWRPHREKFLVEKSLTQIKKG